jgi:hypothetical protein
MRQHRQQLRSSLPGTASELFISPRAGASLPRQSQYPPLRESRPYSQSQPPPIRRSYDSAGYYPQAQIGFDDYTDGSYPSIAHPASDWEWFSSDADPSSLSYEMFGYEDVDESNMTLWNGRDADPFLSGRQSKPLSAPPSRNSYPRTSHPYARPAQRVNAPPPMSDMPVQPPADRPLMSISRLQRKASNATIQTTGEDPYTRGNPYHNTHASKISADRGVDPRMLQHGYQAAPGMPGDVNYHASEGFR